MTKSSILTEIYNSNEVAKVIQTLKPVHLQQDILQHCFLELFEKSEEFIIDLYARNKLTNYIVKILYNTAHFTRTSFKKQLGKEILFDDLNQIYFGEYTKDDDYVGNDIEYSRQLLGGIINEEYEEYEEITVNLDRLYWYKREILKLYASKGTYQKVSDATNIPASSIYLTVLQARREILKQYHKDQKA